MALSHRVVQIGPAAARAPDTWPPATSGPAWFRLSILAAGLFLLFAGWAFDLGSDWATPG